MVKSVKGPPPAFLPNGLGRKDLLRHMIIFRKRKLIRVARDVNQFNGNIF